MERRTPLWNLMEYFQIFFPTGYEVTAVEEKGVVRRVRLHVSNPATRASACHSGPLTDFLDICSMSDIAAELRKQLQRPHLLLVQ